MTVLCSPTEGNWNPKFAIHYTDDDARQPSQKRRHAEEAQTTPTRNSNRRYDYHNAAATTADTTTTVNFTHSSAAARSPLAAKILKRLTFCRCQIWPDMRLESSLCRKCKLEATAYRKYMSGLRGLAFKSKWNLEIGPR